MRANESRKIPVSRVLVPRCSRARGYALCALLGVASWIFIAYKGNSTMHVSDEHFRGRTVIAADGQAIGEVAALLIDATTWTIVALQIKLSKSAAEEIGAARSLLRAATLELPVRMVQSVGDAVLLSVPTLELQQILPNGADKGEQKP